jgi:hypothetical protein
MRVAKADFGEGDGELQVPRYARDDKKGRAVVGRERLLKVSVSVRVQVVKASYEAGVV